MSRLYFLLSLVTLFFAGTGSSKGQTLVHYWNFNTSTDETTLLTPSVSLVSGAGITRIAGGTSAFEIPGTGQNFNIDNVNAREGAASGDHLRFNNPIGGALVFSLPTTGYENVVVKYATRRSAQGAGTQKIEYTTDGSNYASFGTFSPVDGNPTLATFDFSALPATDNNPNFKIKITFESTGGGTGGNNRFDNFTLDGTSSGGDTNHPGVAFNPLTGAVNVAVNVQPTITFNEDIRQVNDAAFDNTTIDNAVELRQTNASGTVVPFNATISGRVVTLVPAAPLLNNQAYYVAVKANMIEDASNNAITSAQSASFTTIAVQTQFTAGDIVFIAYRTNASTPDEVAFLTFVDIGEGTQINFTDAKYTDNAQPQCAGGFTWTAPAGGVKAGSVVTILVDSPFAASVGTVAGSSFGLSSGGEQVIMYTGTAANPNYITALSTNAWVTAAHTSCTGSLSKRPAALTDGTTSINLSTAPGNVSANTVNAYYNGTNAGNPTQLRAAILNPANWIGVGASTPAQTWPTWTFEAPPRVVSATVTSQTTITLLFSKEVTNATATNLANYTGISGLQSATLAASIKTVVLTYANPFALGSSNSLTVSGVEDTEGSAMSSPFVFNFTYSTSVAFDVKFVSVQEDAGSLAVKIKLTNPSTSSIDLVVKGAPFSNAGAQDFTLATQTLNFTGSSELEQVINIPIINDNVAEQDEYIVLSLENAAGAIITGGNYMTIFIKDNDRGAPVPNKEIELNHVGSFDPGSSTAEIVMHDPISQRMFVISSIQDRLDIADFSNPAAITLIKSVDMVPYGGITSVAVKNGIVAVASPNANDQLDGSVVFFNTNGDFQKQVTVGTLPDMITFSPDGTKVMTANEGQPNDAYTSDPEGSVSIIDISGGIATLDQSKVTTLLFTQFNGQEATLIAAGVRKLKTSSTLSRDFEPEYISISADSRKAWVTLQENNAIAEINLETKTITSVWPMGKKDMNVMGNGFDASDNSGIVTISNWPVKAFYIPDAIATYSVGGVNYLLTANEGDEKEYSGLTERTTVGAVNLDPTIFPHAAVLKENHAIGRLRMTNLSGDTDGDGDYDEINIPGGRSFTIWNADTKTKVYDSGDDFERYTSTAPSIAALFNADNESNAFKSRSRAKGPEPEGLTIASINGKTYAFIALERVGGVMVYDITNPADVKFVDYKNSRSLTGYTGDHGPEGIIYISPDNSPNGKGYIAVANEISGTVSVYEILPTPKKSQSITFNELSAKTMGDAAFALTATASSTLAVAFTTTDDEVTISGSQVTLVKAGRVTIKANQAGDATFLAAPEVSQSFCVNPAKPVVTMTGTNTENPVLQSSAAAGNQWYKNGTEIGGATQQTLAVTAPGVYTVKSTVETCASAMSVEFPVIITGDIDQVRTELAILPNPTSDFIKVQMPGSGQKEIQVYQLNGAVKETRTSGKQEEEFDVRTWSEGYYIIQVATPAGKYYGRFVKK